jgi:hypothetical protein
MKRFSFAAAVLLLVGAIAQGQMPKRREAPAPADSASVGSIVSAIYACVSHPAGGSPDFDRMRGIFLYVGMLIPPSRAGHEIAVSDVDSWAEKFQKAAAARKEKGEGGQGFFEREIARKTDCFGNVCQVFSTYESRHTESDAQPFERGINSIQLVREGTRWWVASVAWDAERPDNPIPQLYSPAGKP